MYSICIILLSRCKTTSIKNSLNYCLGSFFRPSSWCFSEEVPDVVQLVGKLDELGLVRLLRSIDDLQNEIFKNVQLVSKPSVNSELLSNN